MTEYSIRSCIWSCIWNRQAFLFPKWIINEFSVGYAPMQPPTQSQEFSGQTSRTYVQLFFLANFILSLMLVSVTRMVRFPLFEAGFIEESLQGQRSRSRSCIVRMSMYSSKRNSSRIVFSPATAVSRSTWSFNLYVSPHNSLTYLTLL